MKCPECFKNIELATKTNKDTGMLFNQWECEEHGKIDPTRVSCESWVKFHDRYTIEVPKGYELFGDILWGKDSKGDENV